MKKIIVILLLIVILFANCNGAKEQKESSNEFVFATWAAGTELKEFKEVVETVNQNANGEYKIKILSIPSSYYVKLTTMIAAKKTPDMFWLSQEFISKYAQLGVISDLTDQMEKSTDLSPGMFYDGLRKTVTYKDRYYGIPWIANPIMVYYNIDLFEEAGVPVPEFDDDWSWPEFIETARQLTKDRVVNGNEYKQYGCIVDGWPNLGTFIWAGGGKMIGDNGVDILFDSDEAIEGLNLLKDILHSGISPSISEVSSLGFRNQWFEKQRVAMYMGGIADDFEDKVLLMPEEEQFRIGYAPIPTGSDGKSYAFNWTASTVLSAENKDNPLAYKALEAMTNGFLKWKIASPRQGDAGNVQAIDPSKSDALKTIEISLQNAHSANYIPEWNEINHMLWTELYSVMLTDPEFDYESMIRDIAERSRALIAKRK